MGWNENRSVINQIFPTDQEHSWPEMRERFNKLSRSQQDQHLTPIFKKLEKKEFPKTSRRGFTLTAFHEKSRASIAALIQKGKITNQSFLEFATFLDEMSRDEEASIEVRPLIDGILDSVKVGSPFCSLKQQYNVKKFSDIDLDFSGMRIHAHRALLSLDPYFKPLMKEGPILYVPEEDREWAQLRLKWLYNALTLPEAVTPTVQSFIKANRKTPLSFTSLLESALYSDASLYVKDGTPVKGHHFLLAASGSSLFLLEDFITEPITVLTRNQLCEGLKYLYSGVRPTFSDPHSQEAFDQAVDFLMIGKL